MFFDIGFLERKNLFRLSENIFLIVFFREYYLVLMIVLFFKSYCYFLYLNVEKLLFIENYGIVFLEIIRKFLNNLG